MTVKATNIKMVPHEPFVIENFTLTVECNTSSSNPGSTIRWFEDGQPENSNYQNRAFDGDYFGIVETQRYDTKVFHRHSRKIKCCTEDDGICDEFQPTVECKFRNLLNETNKVYKLNILKTTAYNLIVNMRKEDGKRDLNCKDGFG